jgi:hypothetical protein
MPHGSSVQPSGKVYRYYICLSASRRGHDTCPVRSIAAGEVEGLVLDGISVTLHAAGIRSLVAELADQEAPPLAASEPLLEAAE